MFFPIALSLCNVVSLWKINHWVQNKACDEVLSIRMYITYKFVSFSRPLFFSQDLFILWELQEISSRTPAYSCLSLLFLFFLISTIYFMFFHLLFCVLTIVNGRNRKPWDSVHIYFSIWPTSIFDMTSLLHCLKSCVVFNTILESSWGSCWKTF